MKGGLAAFAAALLSGLGVGSGGVYLLYLTEVVGMPQYAAQAQNLVFFLLATCASTLQSLRAGYLRPSQLLVPLLCGLPGAALGALLTRFATPGLARTVLGAVMLAAGLFTLLGAWRAARREKTKKMRGSVRKIP